MPRIKVQKVEAEASLDSFDDVLARFCYYYPAYTFAAAKRMPYPRVLKMLRVANEEHARHMLDMLQVIVAPHTKNGKGIDKAVQYFKELMKSHV